MLKAIKRIMILLVMLLLFTGCGDSGGSDDKNTSLANSSDDKNTSLGDSSDLEAPKITLKGNPKITIVQGTTYTDAGATAKDNADGTVQVTTSGSVDSSKIGTYTITYTATDKAGNKATKKRVVKVVNSNQNLKTIAKDNTLHEVSASFNGLTIKVTTNTTIDTVSNETIAIYGNIRGQNTGALLKLNANYPNGTKFVVKVYKGATLIGSSQELTYSGSTINFNDIN